MSIVKKGNKELTVDSSQVGAYLKDGFDEVDEKTGKVKTVSPARTYSAAEVEKLKSDYESELAALKKKLVKNDKVGKDNGEAADNIEDKIQTE